MDKLKEIAIGGTAALIIIGGIFYSQIDKIFPDQPTGPGSGEEMEYDPMYDGPGSGEFAKHDNPGSDDYYAGLEDDGPGSGEENNAVGSCNVINDGSVCTDFIGNFWNTPDITTLNCQGVGIYSDNPCPQPSSGGCQNSIGTDYETIIWYYPYGGDPVTGELITYAAGTCTAVGGTYLFTN
ncbi:hypothetical protein HN670_01380 [bacterium]|jgi:hypothetical protein|nr:hypothetical protein [bacterium]